MRIAYDEYDYTAFVTLLSPGMASLLLGELVKEGWRAATASSKGPLVIENEGSHGCVLALTLSHARVLTVVEAIHACRDAASKAGVKYFSMVVYASNGMGSWLPGNVPRVAPGSKGGATLHRIK